MAIKKYGLDLKNVMLVQGTLRPDLIESASKVRACVRACVRVCVRV